MSVRASPDAHPDGQQDFLVGFGFGHLTLERCLEAMAAHDADGWMEVKSHDVYEPTPKLSWVPHQKFKNKARLFTRGNHRRPGIDYNGSLSPVMRFARFFP